jgi:hypothetical protein
MDLLFVLAMMTMSSSIVFGLWQLRSVERELAENRARRRGR